MPFSAARVVALACFVAACGAGQAPLSGVVYGPHARNNLDFYPAPGNRLAPVLIFFHGGSFKGGDKAMFRSRVQEFVAAGIAVVSANYRFSQDAIYPAPFLDGARVVQFVRSKAAEWKVDARKVAVSGSSAGGTLALWIALHDDLAQPQAADAIARLSTRVSCASVKNAPASMDPVLIRRLFGVEEFGAMLALHGARSLEEYLRPDKRKQTLDASPVEHATADDPPLFLDYGSDLTPVPLPPGSRLSGWIHSPRLGEILKKKYDELRLECSFHYRANPAPEGAEIEFLRKVFAAVNPR